MGLKEIPLAFVNTDDSEYSVDVKLNPEFAQDKMTQVKPYDVFTDDNPYFFDKNGNILTNISLKRRNSQYIYEPKSMTEYDLNVETSRFGCTALIKRNMTYSNTNKYNIKIGIAEEGSGLDFANQLISIFGDANKRGKCPANITINDGNMIPQSLIANMLEENDFFIAHSTDGTHIVKDGSSAKLDIDGMLEKHVNVWLSVDEFGDVLQKVEADANTDQYLARYFAEPQLYINQEYSIDTSYTYRFDTSVTHPNFPNDTYKYTYLHPAVLLLEKADCGFVIVTPAALLNDFNNMKRNIALIYEILMNVYMQSYYESAEETSWITDEPVDYIYGQENKSNARHKRINLTKMLADSGADEDYMLVKVDTTNPYVLFGGLTADKDMLFYKVANKTDIPKNAGEVSYLTTKQTVVNYSPEDIYTAESKAKIDYEVVDSNVTITLHPFHSSAHKINFTKDSTLKLESKKQIYCLCTLESSPQIQNIIKLVDKNSYEQQPELYGQCIATVKVITKPSVKTYDIRINGGGLPEDQPDDYNMVDIGHMDGRPYRVGSTMIIRLPKALKSHEDKITDAVNKHIAAGVYPVLIFE